MRIGAVTPAASKRERLLHRHDHQLVRAARYGRLGGHDHAVAVAVRLDQDAERRVAAGIARRITLALWARAPASTSIQARDCIAPSLASRAHRRGDARRRHPR